MSHIQVINYNQEFKFRIRSKNEGEPDTLVVYDGNGKVTIKRPKRRPELKLEETRIEIGKAVLLVTHEPPNYNFDGLWYTSEGYFVEVDKATGWVLDEEGKRFQAIKIFWDGRTDNKSIGQLEIKKRAYDQFVKIKGKIVKWPRVDRPKL